MRELGRYNLVALSVTHILNALPLLGLTELLTCNWSDYTVRMLLILPLVNGETDPVSCEWCTLSGRGAAEGALEPLPSGLGFHSIRPRGLVISRLALHSGRQQWHPKASHFNHARLGTSVLFLICKASQWLLCQYHMGWPYMGVRTIDCLTEPTEKKMYMVIWSLKNIRYWYWIYFFIHFHMESVKCFA